MIKFLFKLTLIIGLILLLKLFFPNFSFGQACTPPSLVAPNNTCSISSDVTVTASVAESSVTFSGFAPSGAVVTIQENSITVGTALGDINGLFSKNIIVEAGVHSFTLFVTDNKGLETPVIGIDNINVDYHTTVLVSKIHFPPTITLTKNSLVQGETITISGQGPPGSTLNLFLNGSKITSITLGPSSTWSFNLNKDYRVGANTVHANLTRSGVTDSANSKSESFTVGKSAAPTAETEPPTSEEEKVIQENRNYLVDLRFGFDLGNNLTWLLITAVFSFQFLLIILAVLLFLWLQRRSKHKKEVLEELEIKVEEDLRLSNPDLRIKRDFWEAEKKLEE